MWRDLLYSKASAMTNSHFSDAGPDSSGPGPCCHRGGGDGCWGGRMMGELVSQVCSDHEDFGSVWKVTEFWSSQLNVEGVPVAQINCALQDQ